MISYYRKHGNTSRLQRLQTKRRVRERRLSFFERVFRIIAIESYTASILIFFFSIVFHTASTTDIISGAEDQRMLLKYIELCVLIIIGIVFDSASDHSKRKALRLKRQNGCVTARHRAIPQQM